MSKVKINKPSTISLDHLVFGIEAVEIEDTKLKAYSSKAYTIDGIRTNSKEPELMDIILLDADGQERHETLSKMRHRPDAKPGEIFLDEDEAINALRKLTEKQFEKAEKAFKILKQLTEKYKSTESIAPDKNAPDIFVEINKRGDARVERK